MTMRRNPVLRAIRQQLRWLRTVFFTPARRPGQAPLFPVVDNKHRSPR